MPSAIGMYVVVTPSTRSIRRPCSALEKTSRPNASVPNRCDPDGGWKASSRFCPLGCDELITLAKIALRTASATSATPTPSVTFDQRA
jgi:hypothetical protein